MHININKKQKEGNMKEKKVIVFANLAEMVKKVRDMVEKTMNEIADYAQ